MARRSSSSARDDGDAPLATNVFALCELAALEWRVYGSDVDVAAASSAHDDATLHVLSSESIDAGTGAHDSELRALFARLQQQQQLTVLEPAGSCDEGSSDNSSSCDASLPRVWLFVVNNGSQDFPAADALGELIEVDSGAWTRASEQALDAALQQRLFRALHALLTRCVLRRHSAIAHSAGRFELRDAAFVYRAPSLSQLNHFDVYLDEALPTSAFELHVRLLTPSYVLCVAVSIAVTDASLPLHGDELGDSHASWRRLLGLPSRRDHSLVDVWHLDDGLVPRIVAETKYKDVHPRFVAVVKRTHKRKSDGDDAADGDDAKKGDEHDDDDGDDDDESARHDGDGGNDTGDELVRRAAPGKKKRKKANGDANENDESVAPVSPDTHVNTPDAPGPTVRVTFPHDTVAAVHYDADVSHFKRRRPKQPTKTSATGDLAMVFSTASSSNSTGARLLALKPDPPAPEPLTAASASRRFSVTDYASLVRTTPTQALLHARRGSLLGSTPTPATPRVDVKPTLSVAVSLVASLSHDEQQEALDGRPTKTHPLLEALESFVAYELQCDLDMRARRVVPSKQLALPSADAYVPRSRTASALLSVNAAVAERVRNRLFADRFAPWISPYAPQPGAKGSKQAKRERQRRLVLAFDEAKLAAYTQQQEQLRQDQTEQFAIRDSEIALGVHLAASDALVAWRPAAGTASRWTKPLTPGTRVATPQEKQDVVERLEPHLTALRSFLTKGGGGGSSNASWLQFADFATHSSSPARQDNGSSNARESSQRATPPQFSVATTDFRVDVPPPVVSEFLLRGFHPVAAPKPVDYAIVCPHSPSEWLGALALSYLTCFRSKYAQCHMGDHAPIDLGAVAPTGSVSVDASNALLLVQCASSACDAFGPYRAAGALLQPLLSQGVKKTQAFSRSAVANVIYLVVPCQRHDVKHRVWALGAFARGLFRADDGAALEDVAWRGSVTIELLFLEDLYEVGVNPNPFVLMPRCFGLYDRVSESVGLKPAETDSGVVAPAQGGKTRFVSERLYHLAERSKDDGATVPHVYAGYTVSADGNWVACSCVDAVGSVLETHMLRVTNGALDDAIVAMMAKWLPFLALFGDRARLVVARVYDDDNDSNDDDAVERELQAWRHASATRADAFVPSAFAPLVASVVLVHARFLPASHVQLRDANVSMVSSFARSGLLAVAPRDRADLGSRRACYARGGGGNLASSCFSRASSSGADAAVLHVSVALDDLVPESEEIAVTDVRRILSDFYALSYLTMHPISTERASPLPVHLAAIDTIQHDLRSLARQLSTDPLALR